MGGSAAILAAFEAAVKSGYKQNLHAILCIAENSVDSRSTRPDDILYMHSGKSVEINNTDAEGRLVLADGVSYASKNLRPDLILDMATLTGAQGICTGQKHAAILANDVDLEQKAFLAGQKSGDWTYPILYAPELLKKEFSSDVADMKNSVKNRANAQSSCAGHFIEDHLDAQFKGKWLHVDIAGPAFNGGRATGFGVAFLLQLLKEI
jgi:probable aminopeptidase NPEPL1